MGRSSLERRWLLVSLIPTHSFVATSIHGLAGMAKELARCFRRIEKARMDIVWTNSLTDLCARLVIILILQDEAEIDLKDPQVGEAAKKMQNVFRQVFRNHEGCLLCSQLGVLPSKHSLQSRLGRCPSLEQHPQLEITDTQKKVLLMCTQHTTTCPKNGHCYILP